MTAWCIRVEFHGRHAPSQTVMRLEAVIALINVIGTSPAGWLAGACGSQDSSASHDASPIRILSRSISPESAPEESHPSLF